MELIWKSILSINLVLDEWTLIMSIISKGLLLKCLRFALYVYFNCGEYICNVSIEIMFAVILFAVNKILTLTP